MLTGCSDNLPEDGIPIAIVNRTINLTNQQFLPLQLVGGHVELNDEGVRGVVIYRQDQNTYRAFERNCSYQPLDSCARVEVETSGFFMIDNCCSSTFDFNGFPTGGPATLPLREYFTFRDGIFLTVSNAP
ncbi:MAG: hypothetical protein ACR2MX_06240 [Cyclobacteriaceae bacterium]